MCLNQSSLAIMVVRVACLILLFVALAAAIPPGVLRSLVPLHQRSSSYQYRQNYNEGQYRGDNSGQYSSGKYVPDDSGKYIHIDNPYKHVVGPEGGFGGNGGVGGVGGVGGKGPGGPPGPNPYGPKAGETHINSINYGYLPV